MTRTKISKTLPKKVLDSTIRREVIKTLKQEHADISAAIKSIAAMTGINANAVAKWFTGQHTPSAAHFLTLAAYYPSVLGALLALIGREDIWTIAAREHIPERMRESLSELHVKYRKCGDILTSRLHAEKSVALNKRQLWFLGELHKRTRLQNKDIAVFWNVTLRTAKRDTEKLIALGAIHSVRSGRTGWFELLERE